MTAYASETSVPVERSRSELEAVLTRYGATAFSYATDAERGMAAIMFRANARTIKFVVRMPRPEDYDVGRRKPSPSKLEAIVAQETRRRWRCLVLVVKAKLEAVSSGIAEFEDEFLAYVQLPDGRSVGAFMRPQVALAYSKGTPPSPLALTDGEPKKADGPPPGPRAQGKLT